MSTPRLDQLHQILVGTDDGDVPPRLDRAAGIGGDDVVGLEPFLLDARQREGAGRLADQRELRDQILGRRRALRLVLVVQVVAERVRCPCRARPPGASAPPPCRARRRASTASRYSHRPRPPACRAGSSAAEAGDRRGRCSPSRRRDRDEASWHGDSTAARSRQSPVIVARCTAASARGQNVLGSSPCQRPTKKPRASPRSFAPI